MIQINNGFNECYYLREEDGMIYNTITKKIIKPDKHHLFSLKLSNSHERKKIALKTLYKLIYNKPFCTDRIVSNESEVWK